MRYAPGLYDKTGRRKAPAAGRAGPLPAFAFSPNLKYF